MPSDSGLGVSDRNHRRPISSVKVQSIIALAVVLLITFVLFLPIRHYQFSLIDDDANVYNNLMLRNPRAQNIGYFWRNPYYELYMPLTSTIWAMLIRLAASSTPHVVPPGGGYTSNLEPSVFHVASLVFHLGVAAIVFLILRRLRFQPWPSTAGALVFAIHPVQIQAVAWITGLNNLTGAFFGLLALYVYSLQVDDRSEATSDAASSSSAIRFCLLVCSTVLFAAGLLSKPTTIVIPLFIAVLELMVWRRPLRRWGASIGFWMLLSIACGLITRSAAADATRYVWSPLWGRPIIVADAIAFYTAKLVFPVGLTFDYTRSPHAVLTNWWGYVTWLLPAVVFWLSIRASRPLVEAAKAGLSMSPRSPIWLRVALLIFVVGLLPTLGIVPNYSQVVSSVFDRYLYIAMLGPAILTAYLLSRHSGRQILTNTIAVAVLTFLAFETFLQLPAWTNMNTLTDQMLVANPKSSIAHHDKGLILGALDDLPGALREFQTEVDIQHATNARGDFYLGVTLVEMGRYSEAIIPLNSAFRMANTDREYWYQLWNALAVQNRLDEAEAVVRKHLSVDASDGRAVFTLGKMLAAHGDAAGALPLLERARIDLPEEPAIPFFLGVALEKLGRKTDAIAAYEQAQQLDPGRKEIGDALLRLQHAK